MRSRDGNAGRGNHGNRGVDVEFMEREGTLSATLLRHYTIDQLAGTHRKHSSDRPLTYGQSRQGRVSMV